MMMTTYKYPDNQVVVVNIFASHIKAWNSDHLPIFESALDNVIRSCHWSQPPLQL
ncbi:UDP-glucose 6-dehydrogenase 1 [Acorus gramineus]|uniref:UDP-glucose 6-dehydrogenase 1 n=1 Tax=Acorus gramineus TaxID=55184 RepID=A0AAV9BGF3_ACOGR|nr:UDP-glucose 6-dehydrogenase 1 [Acorus gramineus]